MDVCSLHFCSPGKDGTEEYEKKKHVDAAFMFFWSTQLAGVETFFCSKKVVFGVRLCHV